MAPEANGNDMKRRVRRKGRVRSIRRAWLVGALVLCVLVLGFGAVQGRGLVGFVREARDGVAVGARAPTPAAVLPAGNVAARTQSGVEGVPGSFKDALPRDAIAGKIRLSSFPRTTNPRKTVGTSTAASLAVVLDDLGPNLAVAEAALDLDFPLTVAILPGYAFSDQIARQAEARGVEILLHQPMETERAGTLPGPGTLYTWMTEEKMGETLDENLDSLGRRARGVNNHMGSGFTADRKAMTAFLNELRRRRLFFLDSVTTADSAAPEAARDVGMTIASRSVFLDDSEDAVSMAARWAQALRRARDGTPTVVIGHGRWETIRFLRRVHRRDISVDFCILSDMIRARGSTAALKPRHRVKVPGG